MTVIVDGTSSSGPDSKDSTTLHPRSSIVVAVGGDFDMIVCSDITGIGTGSRTNIKVPAANGVGEVEFQ